MTNRPRKMKRIESIDHARYLTFSCYRRLELFGNDAIKDAFVENIESARNKMGFGLFAWVTMPEHVHLLVWPDLPAYPVSKIVWTIKRDFAKQVIARWRTLDAPILPNIQTAKGELRFWQRGGGYDRNIFGGDELAEKIRYIHENPVRRGLVERETDWEWSSARWYSGDRDGLRIDEVSKPGGDSGE